MRSCSSYDAIGRQRSAERSRNAVQKFIAKHQAHIAVRSPGSIVWSFAARFDVSRTPTA